MKLWQKQSGPLHPLVEKYTVGNDYHLDLEILPYDLQASLAHAEMLHQIHVLKKTELTKIKAGLQAIQKLHQQQKFTIQPKDEDCHTAIENYLVKKVGPLGSRIHLGRSRNDQVLTALRLYEKSQLQLLQKSVTQTAQTISKFAQKHGQLPMCGYTHGQPAMPSSVKLWAESFAASLKDDLTQLQSVQKLIDQNPLGSAAGYGTCLKLDRKLTTQKIQATPEKLTLLPIQPRQIRSRDLKRPHPSYAHPQPKHERPAPLSQPRLSVFQPSGQSHHRLQHYASKEKPRSPRNPPG